MIASHNIGSETATSALQLSSARYSQRPDKKRFRYDPTRTSLTGYVAEMTLAKLGGEHWRGTVSYQEYNPGFEINEVGFLGSTDMRSIAPLIGYRETRPRRYQRNFFQYLFWNPSWNFDGDMTFNGRLGRQHAAGADLGSAQTLHVRNLRVSAVEPRRRARSDDKPPRHSPTQRGVAIDAVTVVHPYAFDRAIRHSGCRPAG